VHVGEIMIEVNAIVPGERAGAVPAAFAELAQRPLPDGLLRTELLAGRDGEWKIQSLWRDQAALDAMRAGAEPPAAPACSGNSARNRCCGFMACRRATPPHPAAAAAAANRGSGLSQVRQTGARSHG
jgi:hypothetical protein